MTLYHNIETRLNQWLNEDGDKPVTRKDLKLVVLAIIAAFIPWLILYTLAAIIIGPP